jgi:hypothetical protein
MIDDKLQDVEWLYDIQDDWMRRQREAGEGFVEGAEGAMFGRKRARSFLNIREPQKRCDVGRNPLGTLL